MPGDASDFPDYYDPGRYDTAEYPLSADQSLWAEPATDTVGADMVERFRQASLDYRDAALRFRAAFDDARSLGLLSEWQAIDSRAGIAENYIQRIAGAASSAWGMAKSVFGLSGLRRGLGLLPAIPIAYAVVTAAIAWVVAVAIDMRKFTAKVEALKAGVPAGALTDSQGIFSQAGDALKWVAIIAGIVILAPKVFSDRR